MHVSLTEEKTMPNLESTKNRNRMIAARRYLLITAAWAASMAMGTSARAGDGPLGYRILATSKTSTMENELNDARIR